MNRRWISLLAIIGIILIVCVILNPFEFRQYREIQIDEHWTLLVPSDAHQSPNQFKFLKYQWQEIPLTVGIPAVLSVGSTTIAEIDSDRMEIQLDEISEWGGGTVVMDDSGTTGTIIATVLQRRTSRGERIIVSFLLSGDKVYVSGDLQQVD